MINIRKLSASLKALIRRVSLSVVGKDDAAYPTVQATYFGRASNTQIINPYGLCTNPPQGSMGTAFLINGNEESKAAIFNLDPKRLKGLKEGEVALYNYLSKSYIWLTENGDINIASTNSATINIAGDATVNVGGSMTATVVGNTTLTTPLLTLNGNLTVTGQTTLAGVTSNGVNIGDTHEHTGSSTAPDGPVSNTGVPI